MESYLTDEVAMRRFFAVVAAAGMVAALSACGTGDEGQSPGPESVATTRSSSTSTSPTSAAPAGPTTSPPGHTQAVEQAAAPSFVRCQLADGTALLSDGSTTYMDSCNESAGGPMVLRDGTSIYDLQPQVDLDNIPVADGGTCPAARCGYGHDANGNPNPSSGEIQTKHGCDEGYITDPTLCAAVNEKHDW